MRESFRTLRQRTTRSSPRGRCRSSPRTASRSTTRSPSGSIATGRSAARPARASRSASSTAASSSTIRSSGRSRAPSRSPSTRTANRSRPRTRRATCAATAPRVPAWSARSRRRPSSTRCACSAPVSPAPGRCCSPACAGRSGRASTSINMSLSTTKRQFGEVLHELADTAYFRGTILVASAHNMPVESYPVALLVRALRREPRGGRPAPLLREPRPPVEFFARGVDVDVAWLGGGSIRATGNSFATPCISGDRGADPEQAPAADAVPAEDACST